MTYFAQDDIRNRHGIGHGGFFVFLTGRVGEYKIWKVKNSVP